MYSTFFAKVDQGQRYCKAIIGNLGHGLARLLYKMILIFSKLTVHTLYRPTWVPLRAKKNRWCLLCTFSPGTVHAEIPRPTIQILGHAERIALVEGTNKRTMDIKTCWHWFHGSWDRCKYLAKYFEDGEAWMKSYIQNPHHTGAQVQILTSHQKGRGNSEQYWMIYSCRIIWYVFALWYVFCIVLIDSLCTNSSLHEQGNVLVSAEKTVPDLIFEVCGWSMDVYAHKAAPTWWRGRQNNWSIMAYFPSPRFCSKGVSAVVTASHSFAY